MAPAAHFACGAAICRYVPNKPLALVLAFLSHFLLDAIPHFEDTDISHPWFGHGGVVFEHVAGLALTVLAYLLAMATMSRFRSAISGGWGVPFLLVLGGLLGYLPDAGRSLLGAESWIGVLNHAAHWWQGPMRPLRENWPSWAPLISVGMVGVEVAVTLLSAWALLRRMPEDGSHGSRLARGAGDPGAL